MPWRSRSFIIFWTPAGVADIGLPVAVPRRDRPQRAVQYRKEAVSRRI
jgi:hypothetical protein